MKQTLVASDLVKSYVQGGVTLEVLRGVSYTFQQGQTYAVTGVSGSGKSTLLHLLGGLDEPSSGAVFLDGQNLSQLRSKAAVLNKSLGFVFQFHYLIKELSVLENVMLMGLIAGESHGMASARARELLGRLGLTSKQGALPTQLSGGEQQRVSIARAIMNKPLFLIADEPTGNLDEGNAAQVVDLLLAAAQEWGMGLIMCSHDRSVYERMGIVLRLAHGRLE